MKLKSIINRTERSIGLTLAQWDTLNYHQDNDVIDLSKDHKTDIYFHDMNGHFGVYVFIKVDEDCKDQLPKFLKWLEKVSKPTPEYVQGTIDGENGAEWKFSKDNLPPFDDNSVHLEEETKFFMYEMGYKAGNRYGSNNVLNVAFESIIKR